MVALKYDLKKQGKCSHYAIKKKSFLSNFGSELRGIRQRLHYFYAKMSRFNAHINIFSYLCLSLDLQIKDG